MAGGKKKYNGVHTNAADPFAADVASTSADVASTATDVASTSFASDDDDDDSESCRCLWSSAASNTSAKFRQDLAALSRESLPELSSDPVIDSKKVEALQKRLEAAIYAEQINEYEEFTKRLAGGREAAVHKGAMLFGLVMEPCTIARKHTCFQAKRADGNDLGHHFFEVNSPVTVFMDVDSPLPQGCPVLGTDDIPAVDAEDSFDDQTSLHYLQDLHAYPDVASLMVDAEDASSAGGSGNPGEEPTRPRNPWEPSAKTGCILEKVLADSAPRKLDERLCEMNIRRVFEGMVLERDDKFLVISCRYDQPAIVKDIESAGPDVRWAIANLMTDTTFRRQTAAARSLGSFCSRDDSNTTSSNVVPQPRPGELELRKILIFDAEDADDRRQAVQISGERWDFLCEETVKEIEHVLAQDKNLNVEQLKVLSSAVNRRLTLLQGPPGTGKTRTLVSMAAAMLRVLHNAESYAPGEFSLPSFKPMVNWTNSEVKQWIDSFTDQTLGEVAMAAFQSACGSHIAKMALSKVKSMMAPDKEEDDDSQTTSASAPDNKDYDDLAKKFVSLRIKAVDQALAGGFAVSSFWRAQTRDMRIIMCADTNAAADNMLAALHTMVPANTYEIVRIGPWDDLDVRLGSTYHIDNRLRVHPVMQAEAKLMQAMKQRPAKLNSLLAYDIHEQVCKYAQQVRDMAGKDKRKLVQEKRLKLAHKLEYDTSLQLRNLICKIPSMKAHSPERTCAWDDLVDLSKSLRKIALYDIMISAQVVVGTTVATGELRSLCETTEDQSQSQRMSFPIVILDEAGQSTEPSSMIPLVLGAEWVLMGADLNQLPPTIKTNAAKRVLGAGGSLYGRLAKMGIPEQPLQVQYRMHPEICAFPSVSFYGGNLKAAEALKDRKELKHRAGSFVWPSYSQAKKMYPLAFFNVVGGDTEGQHERTSFVNIDEASVTLQLMLAMGQDPQVQSIAILTPYKGQLHLIKRQLMQGHQVIKQMQEKGTFHPKSYVAKTIDGFQGQEADVVILSTVRCNGENRLGFMVDWRRLNVAVTRAKLGLIVVGNEKTLRSGGGSKLAMPHKGGSGFYANYWPALLDWIKERGQACVPDAQKYLIAVSVAALPKEMACVDIDKRKVQFVVKIADLVERSAKQAAEKEKGRKKPAARGLQP